MEKAMEKRFTVVRGHIEDQGGSAIPQSTVFKYDWMGRALDVELETFRDDVWMIMLKHPENSYWMGSVTLIDGQYTATAKGRDFVSVNQRNAVTLLIDHMHAEAMAEKMALQSVVVDNILNTKK